MRKIFVLLCVLPLLLGSLPAIADRILPYSDICTHDFTVAAARDPETYEFITPTQYEAFCVICQFSLPLTPVYTLPEIGQADPETCTHNYYWNLTVIKAAAEPYMPHRENSLLAHHTPMNRYNCTCILCGDVFEMWEMVGAYERCTEVELGDIHMDDQNLHLFIFQCSVCQGISYRTELCTYYEPISDMYCMHVVGEHQ